MYYNKNFNSCTAPNAEKIAVFHPKNDIDCYLFRYDKSEQSETNTPNFVSEYCKGKKCPFYFEKVNQCTRPSQCPYKNQTEKTTFDTIKFNKNID